MEICARKWYNVGMQNVDEISKERAKKLFGSPEIEGFEVGYYVANEF
jgi:hypothetical protein